MSTIGIQAQNDYYFGNKTAFDEKIPTPEEFFGFPIGSKLVRYDKVVEYYKLLADLSDRASLEVIGKTYEQRDYVILIVTSPENLRNLENIRLNHLRLTDPETTVGNLEEQKVIVQLGYNVHGGELAGTEAAVVAAYYFVASTDAETVEGLQNTVLLLEPALNPDGRDRAASFFNNFGSVPPVSDPADIEHSGGFIHHRGNHFGADLNRDWFSLVHPESRARIAFYHRWYPNIYADYHEMGSGSSYYFEPSPPFSTWNHTIPESTYDTLNPLLAKYYSAALDEIGSLYFTKENFDNISPIYGSTYPDFQGGVGTTLEVGSSQGIEIETPVGVRTFARNIRDNVATSIATLKVAVEGKETLLKHQQDFFKSALALAARQEYKHIVFGDAEDLSLTQLFLDNLLRHRIKVYRLNKEFKQNGKEFKPGSAFIVPLSQPQYRLVNAAFEENTQFADSIFMDITAWSTAHGFGIPFERVKTIEHGAELEELPDLLHQGGTEAATDYAYIFDYTDYLAPKALYYLLDKGVVAKAAYKEFTVRTTEGVERAFGKGSIVIPVKYQSIAPDELYRLLQEAAQLAPIRVASVKSGTAVSGIDLGSDNIRRIKKPIVATLVGSGINWTEVGEAWYLLGNRLNIPLTKINIETAELANLERYTAFILVDGDYSHLSERFIEKLRQWIAGGGTLVTIKRASQWAIKHKLATGFLSEGEASEEAGKKKQKEEGKTVRLDYASQREHLGPQRIGGVIFNADLDITNPLAFGFRSRNVYAIKAGNYILPRPSDPYATLLQLTGKPQISGFLTKKNQELLKNAPLVVYNNQGRGTVVLFGESPTFRGYWLSTGRLFTNSIFFGSTVSTAGRAFRP